MSICSESEPSELLEARRGIRQGDPLSQCLFVIVMEYLSRILKGLHEKPDFDFHPRCEKLKIFNLCFADDLLMFARGDMIRIQLLMTKFREFSSATGLKANISKSKVSSEE